LAADPENRIVCLHLVAGDRIFTYAILKTMAMVKVSPGWKVNTHYAEGTPKEYSDIDLAVISDWFKGKPRIENMQYLSRIAASYNSLIEALPFTEEEYRNLDKRSFLASIIQSGRRSSELIDKSV
jgi:hypothetical protein